MMIVCVHGVRDCPGYPGQSAQSNSHCGGQYDISENALMFKYSHNVDLASPWCLTTLMYMYVKMGAEYHGFTARPKPHLVPVTLCLIHSPSTSSEMSAPPWLGGCFSMKVK